LVDGSDPAGIGESHRIPRGNGLKAGRALVVGEIEVTESNYALRLQASLKREAERVAKAEGTTLNQFARADVARALELLDRAGDLPPRDGDEITG
jgi:hypothetical protein